MNSKLNYKFKLFFLYENKIDRIDTQTKLSENLFQQRVCMQTNNIKMITNTQIGIYLLIIWMKIGKKCYNSASAAMDIKVVLNE